MGEEKKWKQYVEEMLRNSIHKVVLSHPKTKGEIYKKISIQKKNAFFQIEKFTDKQVFHENIQPEDLLVRCLELIDGHYLQVNAWTEDMEYALLISKKDSCTMKKNTAEEKRTEKRTKGVLQHRQLHCKQSQPEKTISAGRRHCDRPTGRYGNFHKGRKSCAHDVRQVSPDQPIY